MLFWFVRLEKYPPAVLPVYTDRAQSQWPAVQSTFLLGKQVQYASQHVSAPVPARFGRPVRSRVGWQYPAERSAAEIAPAVQAVLPEYIAADSGGGIVS